MTRTQVARDAVRKQHSRTVFTYAPADEVQAAKLECQSEIIHTKRGQQEENVWRQLNNKTDTGFGRISSSRCAHEANLRPASHTRSMTNRL